MELQTSRFGLLAIDDPRVMTFDQGIPGFPEFARAVLIEVDANPDFCWLQSTEDGDLAFLTVTPWSYFPDFELVLSDDDQADIGLDDVGDAYVCCLVSADEEAGGFTANLRAPIVLNIRTGRAKQVIQPDDRLPIQAAFD